MTDSPRATLASARMDAAIVGFRKSSPARGARRPPPSAPVAAACCLQMCIDNETL
jgi:hypothetical protein